MAHKFVDLSLLDYRQSAAAVQADGIDVLMEMQLHTLGQRMQITAHRPAPLQVGAVAGCLCICICVCMP